MPDTIENSLPAPPPQSSGLDDIAALLAEQLASSHTAATRCFATAADEEDFGEATRTEALKIASRLMQASASAASAIKRIKGEEFHYRVTVDRVDVAAEKAVRQARKRQPRNKRDAELHASINRKFAKIFGVEFDTPEAIAARKADEEREASAKAISQAPQGDS